LFILIELYKIRFGPFDTDADIDASKTMYECIADTVSVALPSLFSAVLVVVSTPRPPTSVLISLSSTD